MVKQSTDLHIAFVMGTFPVLSETFISNQIVAALLNKQQAKIFSYKRGSLEQVQPLVQKHNLLKLTTFFKPKPESLFTRYVFFLGWICTHLFQIHWTHLINSVNFFKHGKKALSLDLFYESQWFLVKRRIDVLHVHFGRNAEKIARLKKFGFLKGIPLVTTFHGFDLIPNKEKRYQQFYKDLLTEGDMFTVNTRYMENILRQLISDSTKISILPVGLDTSYFVNSPADVKDPETFTILFCGRLIDLKGPQLAIQILEKLVELGFTQYRLRIIGDGTLYEPLKQQIKNNNLENHIVLLGAKTQDEVVAEMKHSNVLLMPGIQDPKTGRSETQGLVIQESQALGVPVLVSDTGGMKYGLIPDVTGFIVPEGDIKAFVDKLIFLLENPKIANEMGTKGRNFVVNNYDSNVLQKKLMDIYKKVLLS